MAHKALVVYFSWSNGNTEHIAEIAQKALNADITPIETVVPYPDDYQATVDQGQQEVNSGFEPDINPIDFDVEDYDIVAIGTPTWWYTMAPAVTTFLHAHTWNGKTVIPFMTNGGWPGSVINDIEEACPDATCTCSLEVRFDSNGGDTMMTDEADLNRWADRLKKLVS